MSSWASLSVRQYLEERRRERAGPAVSLVQINNFIAAFVDIDTRLLGNMFTAQ